MWRREQALGLFLEVASTHQMEFAVEASGLPREQALVRGQPLALVLERERGLAWEPAHQTESEATVSEPEPA